MTTKNGSTIDYYDAPNMSVFTTYTVEKPRFFEQSEVEKIDRMYFFKNHIVGENEVDLKGKHFFYLNELTGETQGFSVKTDFENCRSELGLKPKIWTRWFSHRDKSWGFFHEPRSILFGGFGGLFMKILAFLTLAALTIFIFNRGRFSFKDPLLLTFLLFLLLVAIRFYLDENLDSF